MDTTDFALGPQPKQRYDQDLARDLPLNPSGTRDGQTVAAIISKCPNCNWDNGGGRKFCGGCGVELFQPCIGCGASVGIGERHCGACGANLAAAFEMQRKQLQRTMDEVIELEAANRHREALERLQSISTCAGSRLAEYRDRASSMLAAMRGRLERDNGERTRCLARAEEFLARHDYQAAMAALAELPEHLQDDSVRTLRERSTVSHAEITSLLVDIRAGVAQKQFRHLLNKVERLLELKPDHAQGRQLAERLRSIERSRLVTAAQDNLSRHEYAAAAGWLSQIPDFARTAETDALLNDCQSKAAEVDWLLADLHQSALLNKSLVAVARRLLQLQPNNEQAKSLAARLQQEIKRLGGDWEGLPWVRPAATSAWGFPVETLFGFQRIDTSGLPMLRSAGAPRRFGAATGAAVQGLMQSSISTNLMPRDKGKRLGLFKRSAATGGFRTAWGLDLGKSSLKAVRLRLEDSGAIVADACDYLELVAPKDSALEIDVIKSTLAEFLERHHLKDSVVCVTIPGHKVLWRTIAVPRIDAKRLPDLVQYEAQQQIPFPLAELAWDFETVDGDCSDENQNGTMNIALIAAKRRVLDLHWHPFNELGVPVHILQSDCVAWHNFIAYEHSAGGGDATSGLAILDVGADASNFMVSHGKSMWTRTLPVGGLDFTRAIAQQAKLATAKAEQFKRTFGPLPYQVDQAIDPAAQKLLRELAGSIQYYSKLPSARSIGRLLVVGGGSELHGLIKDLRLGRSMANPKLSTQPQDAVGA